MCKLFDIYPKFVARLFEFSCIRKFTSGSASNWHMFCSYNSTTAGKLACLQWFINNPFKPLFPLVAWFGK